MLHDKYHALFPSLLPDELMENESVLDIILKSFVPFIGIIFYCIYVTYILSAFWMETFRINM